MSTDDEESDGYGYCSDEEKQRRKRKVESALNFDSECMTEMLVVNEASDNESSRERGWRENARWISKINFPEAQKKDIAREKMLHDAVGGHRFTDFLLLSKEGDKEVKTHMLMLSSGSAKFEKMLNPHTKEYNSGKACIPFQGHVLPLVVEMVYMGCLTANVMSSPLATGKQLFDIADYLDLYAIKRELFDALSFQNVIQAFSYNIPEVNAECFAFLARKGCRGDSFEPKYLFDVPRNLFLFITVGANRYDKDRVTAYWQRVHVVKMLNMLDSFQKANRTQIGRSWSGDDLDRVLDLTVLKMSDVESRDHGACCIPFVYYTSLGFRVR
jgi:hypothetical protein